MADSDSISGKAPAFQFYPADFVSGTVTLSTEEVGAYILFLCHAWDKGEVPLGNVHRARIARLTPARMKLAWVSLERKFVQTETGYINTRVERERQKQADYRRRQSEKGRASAANRQATGRQPEVNRASTEPQPSGQPDRQPKPNSSVFCLQSSSSDFSQEREPAREKPSPDEVHAFMEQYRDLHQRYVGVAYLGNPQTDYQEACVLVRTFDSKFLYALTVYWLNDGDKFAREGTRTIAKLRSRASKYAEELKAQKLA